MTASRKCTRAVIERRRTRRLAPGAIALSLLMVVGVLVVVTPGSARAEDTSAGPLYSYCLIHPRISVYSLVSVENTSTGELVSWRANPYGGSGYLLFENSTNYSYWGGTFIDAFSAPASEGGSVYYVNISFLEPSTLYYVEAVVDPTAQQAAYPSCYWAGSADSSFTTQQWPVIAASRSGSMLWVNGTVTSGSHTAPSNLEVELACLGGYSDFYVAAWTGALINGHRLPNDAFAIPVYNVPPQYDLPCVDGLDPFVVQVVNDAYNSADWVGYWNESIVLYSPQVVNFHLPANFVGPYVPEVLDFGNFTTGYGEIQYVNTTTTTSIETSQWSVSGGVGVGPGTFSGEYSGSSEVTASISSGHGYISTNGPLDAGCKSDTTGMIQFNALYRTWNVTAQYSDGTHAACGHSVQSFGIQPPTNWLTPGNVGAAGRDIYYVFNDGVQMVAQPEGGGQATTGFVKASTTVAYTNGYGISFGLGQTIPLPGAPSFSFTGSLGWSHTSSTTYSSSLEWTIGGTGLNDECYDVIGQGGSPAGNSADMISIIMYKPSSVDPSGQVHCSPSGL